MVIDVFVPWRIMQASYYPLWVALTVCTWHVQFPSICTKRHIHDYGIKLNINYQPSTNLNNHYHTSNSPIHTKLLHRIEDKTMIRQLLMQEDRRCSPKWGNWQ